MEWFIVTLIIGAMIGLFMLAMWANDVDKRNIRKEIDKLNDKANVLIMNLQTEQAEKVWERIDYLRKSLKEDK